jgi:NAD(P)H-hydrate epimerase
MKRSDIRSGIPVPLFSPTEALALERWLEDEYGLTPGTLMERAGEAAMDWIRIRWPTERRIGILAGNGNNGGDGLALARLAQAAGYEVKVFLTGPVRSEPAKTMWTKLRSAAVPVGTISECGSYEPGVWVDGIFGIGLNRPPEGESLAAIRFLNQTRLPVLSLDVPSGLEAATGALPGGPGTAVCATSTLVFLCWKRGLFTGEAADHVGVRPLLDDLGIPDSARFHLAPETRLLTPEELSLSLPARRRVSQKGDYGRLLIAGGGQGMGGAIRLAVDGALRAGAGLVRVVTRPEQVGGLLAARPEAMVHGTETGEIPDTLLERTDIGVVGCGAGQDGWGQVLCEQMMAWPGPLVVDADGLNWLARQPRKRDRWILTPHPGEAARLLGVETAIVQRDRFAACRQLAERYGAIVVLKGAGTLISGSITQVCPFGNPGMASGGMGDLLAGLIGGLAAQKLPLELAASQGVLVHAMAGDRASLEGGERGLVASDLAPYVRLLVNPPTPTSRDPGSP